VLDGPSSRTEILSRLREILAPRADVQLAVLFGSAAPGKRHSGSDVDVAVLPVEGLLADDLELNRLLTLAAGNEVHLVPLDDGSTLLRWRIANEGVPIVERTRGEFARFQARAAAEYIDFAPALQRSGETFRRRIAESGKDLS
jgi:predicted nucleotidyltransferase